MRRYVLIISMIAKIQSNAKDIVTRMLCRLISEAHKSAKIELENRLGLSKKDTCEIVSLFKEVLLDINSNHGNKLNEILISRINRAGGIDKIDNKCSSIILSHSNDHKVFLSKCSRWLHKYLANVNAYYKSYSGIYNAEICLICDGFDASLSSSGAYGSSRYVEK